MHIVILLALLGALPGDQLLVQPAALASIPDVLPVDVRSQEAFEAGHIAGAAHLDVNSLSETRNGVRGLLRPVDDVRTLLAGAGLAPDRHLVVYSSDDELKNATRMLWILEYLGYVRVSVLDGGYEQWLIAGSKPVAGASTVRPVPIETLPTEVRGELLASKDELKTGACTIVDLRSAKEFSGESKKDFVKQHGHIPQSQSLPADDLVQQDTPLFQPRGVIAELLKQHDARSDRRVVTYCNTGRDATVGYFAYRLMGHKNVAVYDGSMAEWAEGEEVVEGEP